MQIRHGPLTGVFFCRTMDGIAKKNHANSSQPTHRRVFIFVEQRMEQQKQHEVIVKKREQLRDRAIKVVDASKPHKRVKGKLYRPHIFASVKMIPC